MEFECKILSLITYHQTEEDGDEVFLKFDKKKIWPEKERYLKLSGSYPVKINFSFLVDKLEGAVELELWEYDNVFSSQCIGKFNLALSETGGPFTTDLKLTSKDFARYSLEWEVKKG